MKEVLTILTSLWLVTQVFGQGQQVNESFVIQKNRKLELPVAQKQVFGDSQPLAIGGLISKQNFSFDTLSEWTSSELSIAEINQKFTPEALRFTDGKSHLVWGSFGNRINTKLGYQFINPFEQKRRIRFSANHRSLRLGPTDDSNSAQNSQKTNLHVVQPIGDWSLNITSRIDRNAFNYFGLLDPVRLMAETNTEVESAVVWRTNHQVGVANLSNDNIRFSSSVRHQSTKQTQLNTSSEQGLGIRAVISGTWTNQLDWSISPSLDYITITPQLVDNSRTLTELPLQAVYSARDWQVKAGLNWINNRNVLDENSSSYVLPQAVFSYNLGKLQSFQIGLTSNTKLNSVFEASNENLYLNYVFQDYRTSINQSIWFANYIRSFADKHNIKLYAGYSQIRDRAFVIENSLDSASFVIRENAKYSFTYDRRPIGQMSFQLAGNGEINDQFAYDFSIKADSYFLDSLEAPYHAPTFTSNIGLHYQFNQKFSANTQLRYEGGIRFSEVDQTGEIVNLTSQIDYQVNPQVASFISCNNILNQSNTRYYLYPSSPFSISVGLKALF